MKPLSYSRRIGITKAPFRKQDLPSRQMPCPGTLRFVSSSGHTRKRQPHNSPRSSASGPELKTYLPKATVGAGASRFTGSPVSNMLVTPRRKPSHAAAKPAREITPSMA